MNNSWLLEILPEEKQSSNHLSFIGGKPFLPKQESIPHCTLCNSQQTFMFQVAFPDGHAWEGMSLAIFFCTSCADDNHLIPAMLDTQLKGADIPKNFLTDYQNNFRFIVFPSEEGQFCDEYVEKVKFRTLELKPISDPMQIGNKLGGMPNWYLEDETPSTYNKNVPMQFLMQLQANFKFDIVETASSQIELDLMGEQAPSPFRYYTLFIGNTVYFFGTDRNQCEALVYSITQVE